MKTIKSISEQLLDEGYVFFEVQGAGNIAIHPSANSTTGSAAGFVFGVEWGRHGYAGGVLGRTEAMRLADFIIKNCSNITETEEETIQKFRINT